MHDIALFLSPCAGYEFQHPDYSQQNEPNVYTQKGLMIPKRKLEAINHRMTNNTMAKREGTKGQTMIYKSHNQHSKDILKKLIYYTLFIVISLKSMKLLDFH
jgi:hypothetical protein